MERYVEALDGRASGVEHVGGDGRGARPPDDARGRRRAPTQFDPAVVAVLLALLEL